jgi:hypothetical protein
VKGPHKEGGSRLASVDVGMANAQVLLLLG